MESQAPAPVPGTLDNSLMEKYSGDEVLGNDNIQGVAREIGGWTGGDIDEVIQ